MDQFPVLETKRLALRKVRETDAPAFFDTLSRDDVTRYWGGPMQSLEQAEKLVASHASLFAKGTGIRWSITMRGHEDLVIGSCGYYSPNRSYHSIETGYDLHPDYWRQGIMTEAMTAIIEYGFGSEFLFHLNRIVALTGVDNQASAALLEKLGFRREGVLREYGYWQDTYHDVRCFSLLRRDWEMVSD